MLQQAIDSLNLYGIFWFVGYGSHGQVLQAAVENAGVDCYFAQVGFEFENVLYQFDKFSSSQVEEIAERRILARANNKPVPIY